MASAEKTGIADLLSIEVCNDEMCACRSGHTLDPDYLKRQGFSDYGTVLTISSQGTATQVEIRGVPRDEAIIEAFVDCQGPIKIAEGLFACGALNTLIENKR